MLAADAGVSGGELNGDDDSGRRQRESVHVPE